MRMGAMLASLLVVVEEPNCYYLKVPIDFVSSGFKGIIQKERVAMVISY